MKKLFLAIAVSTILTGCVTNPTQQTNMLANILASYTNLKYFYEEEQVVDYVSTAELSDPELNAVVAAMDQLEASQEILAEFYENPQLIITRMPTVKFEFQKIRLHYLKVRVIVSNHWDEYNVEQQLRFEQFDAEANLLNDQFLMLEAAGRTDQAFSTALRMTDTMLKLMVVM